MKISWPPTLIANRYRLLESLGEGGFGEVFRAEDIKFQPPRSVALKLLHPNLVNDPQVREDLKSEAGVLASFNHPHILKVLDYEVTPELAYIVTELATGGSLERQLKTNTNQPALTLTLQQVATYLEQISRGLDEIHARGHIHRDIKPANILLDNTGQVLLADFGLALTLDRAKSSSSSKLITAVVAWGTAEYAAPEIWDDKVGKASDIYALGVLVYQMLTGHTPFQGNAPAVMKQHLQAPAPPLSKYAPQLVYPTALDAIIAKALAKEPSARFKKAGDMSLAFQAVLAGRPLLINPPQPKTVQPLNYLSDLFDKATLNKDWGSVIEIGNLILTLDKDNQTTLTKTAHAYREKAYGLLTKREYRQAFHAFMNAIKLETRLTDQQTTHRKRYLVAIYDLVCATLALFKALQQVDIAAKTEAQTTKIVLPRYDYNRAIALEPSQPAHYFERGKYLVDTGQYEQAIADFSHAIELEKDNFMRMCYYRERGTAYEKKGNPRAARRDFKEADKYLKSALTL